MYSWKYFRYLAAFWVRGRVAERAEQFFNVAAVPPSGGFFQVKRLLVSTSEGDEPPVLHQLARKGDIEMWAAVAAAFKKQGLLQEVCEAAAS